MSAQAIGSIQHHFSRISDPRMNRRKLHKLSDIFFMTLCAVICGADNWVAIAQYCKTKEEWFRGLLDLPNGIPSHDTLGNVFAVIDIEEFSTCFSNWVSDLADLSGGDIISIDGKCLRGSFDKSANKSAIYMVSAWSNKNQIVLGQEKVGEKSNEITAIPKLLEKLILEGSVITIDAMGCQTKITDQIIEKKGDYMISLKGNQGLLHKDVSHFFESDSTSPEVGSIEYDGGHGRVESRCVRATSDIEWLQKKYPKWHGLQSIVAITATREMKDSTSEETRYFITSLDATDPKKLGVIVRSHWGVENNLHWTLDYAFDEDRQRNRTGNSDANMAIIRHTALNLIKNEKSLKVGMKTKRLTAGWDEKYLLKIIAGQ